MTEITRGEVKATLGEALMLLRIQTREVERLGGVPCTSVWEFIEEADAIRWAK